MGGSKSLGDHTMRLSFALFMQRKIHCETVLQENTQIKSENVVALHAGVGSISTPACRICITFNHKYLTMQIKVRCTEIVVVVSSFVYVIY